MCYVSEIRDYLGLSCGLSLCVEKTLFSGFRDFRLRFLKQIFLSGACEGFVVGQ